MCIHICAQALAPAVLQIVLAGIRCPYVGDTTLVSRRKAKMSPDHSSHAGEHCSARQLGTNSHRRLRAVVAAFDSRRSLLFDAGHARRGRGAPARRSCQGSGGPARIAARHDASVGGQHSHATCGSGNPAGRRQAGASRGPQFSAGDRRAPRVRRRFCRKHGAGVGPGSGPGHRGPVCKREFTPTGEHGQWSNGFSWCGAVAVRPRRSVNGSSATRAESFPSSTTTDTAAPNAGHSGACHSGACCGRSAFRRRRSGADGEQACASFQSRESKRDPCGPPECPAAAPTCIFVEKLAPATRCPPAQHARLTRTAAACRRPKCRAECLRTLPLQAAIGVLSCS